MIPFFISLLLLIGVSIGWFYSPVEYYLYFMGIFTMMVIISGLFYALYKNNLKVVIKSKKISLENCK